ncbi:MAG: aspartate carbamoyltransferase [Gammaproteobacteria bacterium]|nr:MAG: aspartate carbamoyltransferase [Gammaproteobacteria bacterium]
MVNRTQPLPTQPLKQLADSAHTERCTGLLEAIEEDSATLLDLANQSVVSARQFDRNKLTQLCRLAAKYENSPAPVQRPLTGKILISAFYEPSTRTRLSFESAWHRLGGDIMSITDPATTGIAKGESYRDIAEMLSGYGDVVVLRDSNGTAIYEMMKSLRIPIINAGNGTDEHPTQALADMYTIFKWRPALLQTRVAEQDRIRIGIIGVPGEMRTVRSLLLFLSLVPQAIEEVVVICNSDDVFSPGQREELEERGLRLRVTADMEAELPSLDVVYINAIVWSGGGYQEHGSEYRLSKDSPLKKDAIILHPLARGEELSTDLDETTHNWYFAQARGAVFIRMALLTCYVWLF